MIDVRYWAYLNVVQNAPCKHGIIDGDACSTELFFRMMQ